jgi:magnesium-transporting ATPase (P-type)
MKGAPEELIKKCTSHFDASGNKAPMNDEDKTWLNEKMEESMDKECLRTIAFSFKDYTEAVFKQLVTDT